MRRRRAAPPASGGWALVGIAALDVRAEPDHRAELMNQLLLGEVVRVLRTQADGGWREVQGIGDGYRGWARAWGLVPVSAARAVRWRRRAVARAASLFVEARTRPGAGWLLTPLFWESRVIPGPLRGTHRRVTLPDGRSGWVPARSLARERRPPMRLGDRVQQLLGVPYLWGGRTPAGLDCSAFAQLLLAEQGVALPRDTSQQVIAFPRLGPRDQPRPGDLIFFRGRNGVVGHVGVGLGNGYFAHCRGVVRISTVEDDNALCDNELKGTEAGWYRPTGRARTGVG